MSLSFILSKQAHNVLLCDRNGADTHLESVIDCGHTNDVGFHLDTHLADRTAKEVEQTAGNQAGRTRQLQPGSTLAIAR